MTFPLKRKILPHRNDITPIENAHPKKTEDISALTKPIF